MYVSTLNDLWVCLSLPTSINDVCT